MTKPILTHAVAVVEADDKHALIVCGSNNEHRYWVPLNALHPLPPPDPLAERRAAALDCTKTWVLDMNAVNYARMTTAVHALLAAESALAQPEPEPLQECPLCQSVNVKQMPTAGDDFCIVCSDCGLQTRRYPSFSEARAAWNTRPERSDARAVIEELIEAANHYQQRTIRFYEVAKEKGYPVAWNTHVGSELVAAETRYKAIVAAAEALGGGE